MDWDLRSLMTAGGGGREGDPTVRIQCMALKLSTREPRPL